MLKKPPKDQLEAYVTPPVGKLFKGTTHHQEIPRRFSHHPPRLEHQKFIKGKGAT